MSHRSNAHAELVRSMLRSMPVDGSLEILEGVSIHRLSKPKEPLQSVSRPAFCVIAQGRKDVRLGESLYTYDQDHYLIASVDLPVTSQVVEASVDEPYLSIRMELDPALVSSVLTEAGGAIPHGHAQVRAIDVSPLDDGLRDAVLRLVRLAEEPVQARYLAPLVKREIVFRLLTGNQGARLQHLAVDQVANHGISRAIERLRRQFDQPLRIDALARDLGMSVSGFHHHFKAVTAMSPLQFQKQLRLQEARRLMIGEGLDATSAGYRVGYGNASHFNREYKRLFGNPPIRDVEQLRGSVPGTANL